MAVLTRKINMISRSFSSYRAKKSKNNLPGVYHSYVLAICNNPGWSQDRLAKHLCLNKSNVTRHLSYLEDNGFIERRICEKDKREMRVFPTPKMLSVLPEVVQITEDWNKEITEGISENNLIIFMDVLEKIANKSSEILDRTEAYHENSF